MKKKNMLTRFGKFIGMMAIAIAAVSFTKLDVQAEESSEDDSYMGISFEDAVEDDSTAILSDGDLYIGSDAKASIRSANYTQRSGIDVSKWNTITDWNAVRSSGIEFVFVKVAGRDRTDGSLYTDSKYDEYIKGAQAAGLKVGVYFFSQALNEAEAVEEADYTLGIVQNYNIQLPVIMDYEWTSGNRLENGGDVASRTATIKAFLSRITSYGYAAGLYSSDYTIATYMDGASIAANYKMWVARYGANNGYPSKEPTYYTGAYDFWQYTSRGTSDIVAGVSGFIDCDYWYDDGTISGKNYAAVFNADYYAAHNPDVVAGYGSEPAALLRHFIENGMAEGRQGCESFNVLSYYNQYPDLRNAFGKNWTALYNHYMTAGVFEGRNGTGYESTMVGYKTVYNGVDYAAVYDFNYYYENNADVASVFGWNESTVLEHFVQSGMYEGRQAKSTFNLNSYKYKNYDLRLQFGDDNIQYYEHYISCGKSEGRVATGYENAKWTDNFCVMYRMYNPNSGEHFYTTSVAEKRNLVSAGWNFEGRAWVAPKSGTAVYRVYNPNAGDHHYTTNYAEVQNLVAAGWNYEGIGWYSDTSEATPLYRLYNPNAVAGAHHFTTNAAEKDALVSVGWKYEGIAWYGL